MMRTRSILLAVCASATVLVAAAPAAATVTLGLTAGEDAMTSTEAVSFTAGEVTVRCAVTLTGSFNEAIVQASGESVGSVTRATAASCAGGERPAVTFLSTPWSLTYRSFTGTEPERVTAILASLNGFSVNIASGLLSCLYRGEVGLSFALSGSEPYPVGTISTLTNSLTLVSGAGCARTASTRGTFRLAREQWLTEYASGGTLVPDSPRLSALVARTGATVTFQNVTTATVVSNGTAFANGATGWTLTSNGCNAPAGILEMRFCQIVLTSAAATTAGQFQLRSGATVLGIVNLVPQ